MAKEKAEVYRREETGLWRRKDAHRQAEARGSGEVSRAISRSSRASSSAVNLNRAGSSALADFERRRQLSHNASPPPASAMGGNSHSSSVWGSSRGFSSTNSP